MRYCGFKNMIAMQVTLLLQSWDLHKILGPAFFDQQIDGDLLSECEKDDFSKEDYPNVKPEHWQLFWYGTAAHGSDWPLRNSKIDCILMCILKKSCERDTLLQGEVDPSAREGRGHVVAGPSRRRRKCSNSNSNSNSDSDNNHNTSSSAAFPSKISATLCLAGHGKTDKLQSCSYASSHAPPIKAPSSYPSRRSPTS